MPSRPDAEASSAHGSWSGGRSVLLTVGLVLAVAATAASFLTDDPRYLRLAVVAAAWGFVAAAYAATRRRGELHAAAVRETEVRRAYERELDLEAVARREYELELENDLRRETEEVVRGEVAALRADVAALDRIREQIGRMGDLAGTLPALRSDVAALAALRTEVASLAALRGDVAALGALREELGALGELRAEVGRLRTELTEQLNGEMLIERIIMRTQGFRKPGETPPAPAAAERAWDEEPPPRELTGGWPVIRLDDPGPSTREYETVRPVRSSAGPPSEPRTSTFSWSAPEAEPAPTPLEWLSDRSLLDPAEIGGASRSRHAAAEPSPLPPPSVPDDLHAPARPVPYRRRRTDDEEPLTDPAQAVRAQRPAVPPAAYRPEPEPDPDPEPRTQPGTSGDGYVRVSDLVAETGGQPPPGGRRQRRYREEDEPDDVLARVLGER